MSSSAAPRDRRQRLLAPGAVLNGIDYVEVAADQTRLSVHFLNQVPVAGTLAAGAAVTITGGEVITTVGVRPIDPATAFTADSEGRPILAVTVNAPGDFSTYRLAIDSPALDPFFAVAQFSFKAGGPADADPGAPPPAPGAPAGEAVSIDYTAKDFDSFVAALSDFSAGRYPAWQERSEADLGMVLMEALAALGDELSYMQDRVSAEASIVTATQKVSVLRHARLVDYEPAPATVATALLALDVTGAGVISTPLHCTAIGSDGATIDFEIGSGLTDPTTGGQRRISVPVDPRWNRHSGSLTPYWWDDSERVLAAGATTLDLLGTGLGLYSGQQLLLDTPAPASADPPIREVVIVAATAGVQDLLLANPLTRVTLTAPTAADHDLTVTAVAGNLAAAVQGQRVTERFVIPGPGSPAAVAALTPAIVRAAANSTAADPRPEYRYCLAADPLAWVGSEAGTPAPVVIDGVMVAGAPALSSASATFTAVDVGTVVTVSGAGPDGAPLTAAIAATENATTVTLAAPAQTAVTGATVTFGASPMSPNGDITVPAAPELVLSAIPAAGEPQTWRHVRWLLDADPGTEAFTLTPERYAPVLSAAGHTWSDYDGDAGTTIRFGDGTFGTAPAAGVVFTVLYRVGAGAVGNVPADTIVTIAPGQQQSGLVAAVTNPFAAVGGGVAESNAQIAARAPQAFAARPLTLVTPADYVAAAQSLPAVQQAGTTFRWTGSWLSALTIADPAGAEQPDAAELIDLTELLDGRRLAGYESYVLAPRYVSIDLELVICADASDPAAAVRAAVVSRLSENAGVGAPAAFFDHANWGFGQALSASALLAAVQSCPGVAGVVQARYRRRGVQTEWTDLPETLVIAPDQILRVDNDPNRPDAGLLTVIVQGGR